jgi:hypothetical protein
MGAHKNMMLFGNSRLHLSTTLRMLFYEVLYVQLRMMPLPVCIRITTSGQRFEDTLSAAAISSRTTSLMLSST